MSHVSDEMDDAMIESGCESPLPLPRLPSLDAIKVDEDDDQQHLFPINYQTKLPTVSPDFDSIDLNRLIDLVSQHENVWFIRTNRYMDIEKVNHSWEEISREMQVEDVSKLKSKWRNLRDTYVKHRKRRSSSSRSKGKKWKYFDKLSFLNRGGHSIANGYHVKTDWTDEVTQQCEAHGQYLDNGNPSVSSNLAETVMAAISNAQCVVQPKAVDLTVGEVVHGESSLQPSTSTNVVLQSNSGQSTAVSCQLTFAGQRNQAFHSQLVPPAVVLTGIPFVTTTAALPNGHQQAGQPPEPQEQVYIDSSSKDDSSLLDQSGGRLNDGNSLNGAAGDESDLDNFGAFVVAALQRLTERNRTLAKLKIQTALHEVEDKQIWMNERNGN